MKFGEIITKVTTKHDDITKTKVEEIVKTIFSELGEAMENAAEGEIVFTPIGTFKKYQKKATSMISPATKQKIEVPAKMKVKFKLSSKINL